MNQSSETSQSLAGDGGPFDPRQAAALLQQATEQARRTFAVATPLLWTYRALVVLGVFGGCWLSVRDQNPYTGPSGWVIPVGCVLVAGNIAWSAVAIRRTAAGVSGPSERLRRAWIGVMIVALIAAYAFMAPLYQASESHSTWGVYPSSAPMLVVGLFGALTAAARRDWHMSGACLAVAVVAAAAEFGGPAGSWLIMGIGLGVVCLGTAALIASQQHRGLVRA